MSDLEAQKPVREGLPPNYRMRADSHYVDLIEARATHAPTGSTPSASALDGTQRRSDDSDPTLQVGRDLARALTTVGRCAELLSDVPSGPSRAVVGNLIRAETWRASALLHATRLVRRELPIVRTAISVPGLLDKVTLAFQPERRVRGISVDARSTLPDGSVVVADAQIVAGAMSWAVLTSLVLLDGVDDARLTVSASSDTDAGLTFAVSQPNVTPPAIWQSRAFDPTWTDRPGGVSALVWMLAIQEAARAHEGIARVERSDRGTSIGLTLPAGV